MRVAMLGHRRVPSREGGVEVVVTELATRMAELGHEVTAYGRRGRSITGAEHSDAETQGFSEYRGVRIRTVPTLDAPGLAAATSSVAAMRAALADRPDVVHVHAEGPAAVCGMAARAGVPCVVTVHGLDWRRAKWGRVASRYILHGERQAVRHADRIIVLSRSAQDYFRERYGRSTVLVPNGIEPKERVEAGLIADKYGLAEGSYVLYLGRMVPEKGVHYLIDAWRMLGACGATAGKRLVIAGGSGDADAYYQSLRESAADLPDVLFTGFVEGRELAEFMSNAYLYVLPSDLEGMPMSLLEAMAYGRCCLTSDIPECADVLDGCGLTFARGDAADLAASLEAVLEDPAWVRQMGAAAERRALEAFSWDATVAQTLDVYRAGVRTAHGG